MIELAFPTGVLLINLGTPDAPDAHSVKKYLSEFLNDPRVVDLPWLVRKILVHGFILRFRPKISSRAYRQIWTQEGSPLLLHSQKLAQALAAALGENYVVELGMRYGKPNIAAALHRLKEQQCQKLVILPLFPQYSSSATGSALAKTLAELGKNQDIPEVYWINCFFDHPEFINAWKELIIQQVPAEAPDMWIFSYHGLPVRHLNKRGCDTADCLANIECGAVTPYNQLCYRRQCFATSRLLAETLQLTPNQYRVGFQSRLGRTPWITPYTDQLLTELAGQGIKRIAMVCPSFTVDCLETLEEIGLRAKAQWHSLGGEAFTLLPCLNADPTWVKALAQIVTNHATCCNNNFIKCCQLHSNF
jgi:protoporphyrin/coproporphyrin ferrochelatase